MSPGQGGICICIRVIVAVIMIIRLCILGKPSFSGLDSSPVCTVCSTLSSMLRPTKLDYRMVLWLNTFPLHQCPPSYLFPERLARRLLSAPLSLFDSETPRLLPPTVSRVLPRPSRLASYTTTTSFKATTRDEMTTHSNHSPSCLPISFLSF